MPKLTITAPFKALPQGSKNAYVMGNRAVLVEGVKNLKQERARLSTYLAAEAYKDKWIQVPQYTPVILRVVCQFQKPASVKREQHVVRPDLSKLIRYVEDAIVDAGLIHDDSQIYAYDNPAKIYGDRDAIFIEVSYV